MKDLMRFLPVVAFLAVLYFFRDKIAAMFKGSSSDTPAAPAKEMGGKKDMGGVAGSLAAEKQPGLSSAMDRIKERPDYKEQNPCSPGYIGRMPCNSLAGSRPAFGGPEDGVLGYKNPQWQTIKDAPKGVPMELDRRPPMPEATPAKPAAAPVMNKMIQSGGWTQASVSGMNKDVYKAVEMKPSTSVPTLSNTPKQDVKDVPVWAPKAPIVSKTIVGASSAFRASSPGMSAGSTASLMVRMGK